MDTKNRTKNGFFQGIITCILLLCTVVQAEAQSSSFLADGVQDFLRREQLSGKVGLVSSFSLRSFMANYRGIDSLLPAWKSSRPQKTSQPTKGSLGNMQVLPFSVTMQYNSHHAYGQNDGAMVPAAGLQTMFSAGLLFQAGNFSLQLKPEFVYAQNADFETFPAEHYDVYWADHYRVLNRVDQPEKFGDKRYQKIFPGQSSLRYQAGAFSAGISTENLWWGPGRYNALVMSNNAPGFAHLTVNTTKPIQTALGSFEGQLIGGILTSSGIFPADTNRSYNGVRLYQRKNESDRYIAGMMLSWQPKWVKGLFVGFTKASYLYRADISGVADVLPLEGLIVSSTEKNGSKAALGSLFARYVMPEEQAELYLELGRSDRSPSLLNLITDHDYPRAYVAGFRKLFTTRKQYFIDFSAEFTQLTLPNADLIQQSASWYTHSSVRQGYTNRGQVLGAGIGPGSNSQLLDLSWVKGFNRVGLTFERLVHNNDFFYKAFASTQDYTRHWVDISTTLHADWHNGPLIFSGRMGLIRSLNYQWFIFPGRGYFQNGYDVLNFHGALSVAYRL